MTAFTILDLHARVALVCPIIGVSAASMTDRAQWLIRYAPEATAAQKAAAQTAIWTAPNLTPPEGC